jgi:hypothetical protein
MHPDSQEFTTGGTGPTYSNIQATTTIPGTRALKQYKKKHTSGKH